jgi:hypothetical protein
MRYLALFILMEGESFQNVSLSADASAKMEVSMGSGKHAEK